MRRFNQFCHSGQTAFIESQGKVSSLGLLLIVIIIVFAAFFLYFYFVNPFSEVIKKQLSALHEGKMDIAYSYMADETKAGTSLKDFKQYIAKYPIMSSSKSVSISEENNDENEAYVKGMLTAENGNKATIEYRLLKDKGVWKIFAIRLSTTSANTKGLERANYKEFKDKKNQYVIEYPANWVMNRSSENIVSFYGKEGTISHDSQVSLEVVPAKSNGGKYEDAKAAIDALQNNFTANEKNVKVVESGKIRLLSQAEKFYGEYFIATYTHEGRQMKKIQIVVATDGGSVFYFWSYTSPVAQYDIDLPTAKAMFESWTID